MIELSQHLSQLFQHHPCFLWLPWIFGFVMLVLVAALILALIVFIIIGLIVDSRRWLPPNPNSRWMAAEPKG